MGVFWACDPISQSEHLAASPLKARCAVSLACCYYDGGVTWWQERAFHLRRIHEELYCIEQAELSIL